MLVGMVTMCENIQNDNHSPGETYEETMTTTLPPTLKSYNDYFDSELADPKIQQATIYVVKQD